MAATPVDDHTEEFEQLAGLSALRVLEGEELERFERHAASCERCQVMVRLDREALARLSLAAPEMEPSPDFKARLMQRAAQELAARTASSGGAATSEAERDGGARVEPTPIRPADRPAPVTEPRQTEPRQLDPRQIEPRERAPTPRGAPANVIPIWRRRSPWLNAIAAVVVLAAVSFGAYSYENQPIATVQISGSGPGSAVVVVRRSGAAELDMRNVPDPGPGFIYEAWIIKDGKPVAAGTAASGNVSIPLEGDPRGSTVAVTRERTRVDAPTSTPFLAGEVRL